MKYLKTPRFGGLNIDGAFERHIYDQIFHNIYPDGYRAYEHVIASYTIDCLRCCESYVHVRVCMVIWKAMPHAWLPNVRVSWVSG